MLTLALLACVHCLFTYTKHVLINFVDPFLSGNIPSERLFCETIRNSMGHHEQNWPVRVLNGGSKTSQWCISFETSLNPFETKGCAVEMVV